MSPEACKAARALVGFSQKILAEKAHLSPQTVADFERGTRTPHPNNLAAISHALENSGIEFIKENDCTVGVKLVQPKKSTS